jgi:hypothetical protein
LAKFTSGKRVSVVSGTHEMTRHRCTRAHRGVRSVRRRWLHLPDHWLARHVDH